jgi:CheY-like chemotaxis protein
LTRDLLGFARKGKYTKEIISLEEAVQRVVDLLKRTISKKIAIYTRLDESLAPVEGDASQLENALMNVCINAADAMSGEGQLVIESSNVEISDAGQESWVELAPGLYVRLRVSDSGVGMDQETLERAFEPFYTTKPQGQGTGLGLSMVYGVIRNHGGSVLIDSAPGRGTTVTMMLPGASAERVSDDQVGAQKKPSEVPGDVGVLLVDDEPLVIRSTKRLLERLGYRVFTAVNGRDGLEVYRSCHDQIEIVVLDLLMPEMDGAETLRELQGFNPTIKVVMATGFTEDSKIEELLAAGAQGFVEKPFDIEDLAAEMKRVLRGEKHSRTGKSSAPPG